MSKDNIVDFDSTPVNNSDIGGINIAENCPASNINNAIRQLMTAIKAGNWGGANINANASTATDLATGSVLAVAKGGTGGTTEAGARSSLGLGSASVKEAVATSIGAADAGKVPVLGADGRLETGFVDFAAGMNASGSAPLYAARGWVTFTGTGTPAIRASGNVSSISDNGVGAYTVNLTTPLPDANYGWCINGKRLSTDGDSSLDMFAAKDTPPSVSALKILFNNGNSTASIDPEIATVAFFR